MASAFAPLRVGVLTGGGLVLAAAVVWEAQARWPEGAIPFLAAVVTTASWLITGAVSTHAHPRMVIGWLLMLGGLSLAVDGALTSFAEVIASRDGILAAWAGWVGSWLFWPQLAASAAVYLLFPGGRLPGRRWRAAVALAIVGAAIGIAGSALAPGPLAVVGPLRAVSNPLGLVPGIEHAIPVAAIILNLSFIAGLIALRIRKVTAELRGAVRFVFWLGLVNLAVGLLLVDPPGLWAYSLGVPVTITLSAAVCAAIVRGPLWDVRATIGRATVSVVLAALIVTVFVALVFVAGFIPIARAGQFIGVPLAAVVVCLCFAPTQHWLRRVSERMLYGDRGEPYAMVSSFGAVLETAGEPREALQKLVDLAVEAFHVPWVAVLIASVGPEPVAMSGLAAKRGPLELPGPLESSGDSTGQVVVRELRYQGQEYGRLVVGLRTGERDFSPSDSRLLDDLARQAGAASFALAIDGRLRSHSAELVMVRDEERHRLQRDLHDGVASRITALGLSVEVAADLAASDSDRASSILARVREDLAVTLTDVRRIVDDLGPTETLDLGLERALAVLCERFSGNTLTVHSDVKTEVDSVDPAVGTAAYWIAAEALHNMSRHSAAGRGELSAEISGADLVLRVSDNGHGMIKNAASGVGMASMRARATARGGSFAVGTSAEGGTEIVVRLPAGAAHA